MFTPERRTSMGTSLAQYITGEHVISRRWKINDVNVVYQISYIMDMEWRINGTAPTPENT
jgi:hypothetical protein